MLNLISDNFVAKSELCPRYTVYGVPKDFGVNTSGIILIALLVDYTTDGLGTIRLIII